MGCWMPMWSITSRVSGCRPATSANSATLPQHSTLTGSPWRAAAAHMLSTPSAWAAPGATIMIRAPTTPGLRRPLRQRLRHGGVARIEGFDDPESTGVLSLHLHRVTRIEAVERERRHEQGAVDAHAVHERHRVVAGDLCRPVRRVRPRTLGPVALVAVHLGVDDRGSRIRHFSQSSEVRNKARMAQYRACIPSKCTTPAVVGRSWRELPV